MKTTKDILGLRIISIVDGTQVGHVKDLILNAQGGALEFVIADQESDYLGARVIAFSDVLGIGEFALTIPNPQVIQAVAQNPVAQELLKQDVRVIGTKVLTKKGQLIGEVEEIQIDETSGKIASSMYKNPTGEMLEIMGDQVITFGKELLIVESLPEENKLAQSTKTLASSSEAKEQNMDAALFREEQGAEGASSANSAESDFNLFEQRQLQYFIGKATEKDIVLDNGETLPAGVPMTEATIQQITKRNTLMEISSHLQKH